MDLEVRLPGPKPLLVLKVKAAWDRNYRLEAAGGDLYLNNKVKKDRFDVLSLFTTCEMRQDVLNEIILDSGFKECFIDAVSWTIADRDALEHHNLKGPALKRLGKKVKKILADLK